MFSFALCAALQVHGVSFVEEASARSADVDGYGRGTAMADFDGDGWLDLYVADGAGADRFLRGVAGGSFVDVSVAWGVPLTPRHTMGALAADFDGDGDLDLFLPCGGDSNAEAGVVLRNDLAAFGTFTDLSASAGGAGAATSASFSASALDFDRDGDLDLFLAGHKSPATPFPVCSLLRNDGALYFTDVSAAAGITDVGNFMHCGAGDLDGDGWQDVVVAAFDGPLRWYRNRQDGTFERVAGTVSGMTVSGSEYGALLEDFDHDGDLDVFVPRYAMASPLYLNDGFGSFTDVSAAAGIGSWRIMGHTAADFDLDGTLDLFFGTGAVGSPFPDELLLLAPLGPGGALQATHWSVQSGISAYGDTRCHGMATGDLDGDGDLDLYLNHGGPSTIPSTSQRNALWINQGNANAWLRLALTGTRSPRTPAGARATARLPGGGSVVRTLQVGRGFASTDEPVMSFGLGASTAVQLIEILWPSGLTQTVLPPSPRTTVRVFETGLAQQGVRLLDNPSTYSCGASPAGACAASVPGI
ncbi:MAG: CRTAC1 family protein [Planctomycetota bacterium]|nr:CRTAC1 family protein [Planctomycetota bacterium]